MKRTYNKLTAFVFLLALILTAIPAAAAPATGGEKDYLENADLIYLGSDYFAQEGEAIASAIASAKEGTYTVDAVPGAVLTGREDDSYVSRADQLTNEDKRVLLVELPSQDLGEDPAWGSFDYTYDKTLCDTDTLIGALDYIFNVARDTEMVGVLVIPPTAEGDAYQELEAKARELQEKWGYLIIDLRGQDNPADVILTELGDYLTTLRYNYKNMFIYAGNLPQFDPENYETNPDSPLKGLNIIQLGSSVTFGSGSMENSFVEFIAQMTGSEYVKEAVPGTTMSNLATQADTSYINRMLENLDPEMHADLFLCQLSTNDASKRVPLGEISDSEDPADYDLETVAGAIQYIITYARDTWNCPIMFYTGTKYSNEAYGEMVDLLLQIQEKYDIGVIDMYHDLDTDVQLYNQYISFDGIHPTKRGYGQWWAPYMVQQIEQYLADTAGSEIQTEEAA